MRRSRWVGFGVAVVMSFAVSCADAPEQTATTPTPTTTPAQPTPAAAPQPADVDVPDVTGLATSDAAQVLTDAGFTVATELGFAPDGQPAGTALWTVPAAGRTLPAGTLVTVVEAAPAAPAPQPAGTPTTTSPQPAAGSLDQLAADACAAASFTCGRDPLDTAELIDGHCAALDRARPTSRQELLDAGWDDSGVLALVDVGIRHLCPHWSHLL